MPRHDSQVLKLKKLFHINLTRTGSLMLGMVLLFTAASITSQSGLLLTFSGLLVACLLINFVLAWKCVRNVSVVAPPSVLLCEGQKTSEPWKLTNLGRQPAGFLEITSAAGQLLRLARLDPGESMLVPPTMTYSRRGVYPYSEVRLQSDFPFGLVSASRTLDLTGEAVVYPALFHASTPSASAYDLMVGGKHRGRRQTVSGSHFAGVRPLQPGDSLKQIHWKSSAKGLGLMVKTYDEELSGRVAVIVDADGETTALDDCARAAGSLIFAALDEGHHVEWIDLGTLEARLIPPFDDGHELLDALARLEGSPGCRTPESLRNAVSKLGNKCAINFVLMNFDEGVRAVVTELQQQRRHVAIYLPASAKSSHEIIHDMQTHYYHSSGLVSA